MKARKSKKGQTMVEYIIIVALIAVFMYFGRGVSEKVTGATKAISQEEGDKAQQAHDSLDENTIKQLK